MINLKNKNERETFVKDYKNWIAVDRTTKFGVWKSIPELDLNFYRYEFANGAVLIVTEYKNYKTVYGGDFNSWGQDFVIENKFCLILPDGDNYLDSLHTSGSIYHKTYTLDGCSMGTVVDYMTKNKLYL